MPTRLYAITLMISFLAVNFAYPAAAQSRWDGADDLPVNPLACPGDVQNTPRPVRFDGGQPTNPPTLAGQSILVVDVPRTISDDYDRAVEKGMIDAANELGSVQLVGGSASVVSVSQQTSADGLVNDGVNGILVATTEGEDISVTLNAALDAGIHVVSYDADVEHSAREWFVQPAAYNAVAKALVDDFVDQAGESASFGVLTSGYDSPQAGRWIAEMWAYARQCYPSLEWLETAETQGDPVLAYNQAALLLNEYGRDLSGFISVTTVATPNVARAVSQGNACGTVAVVGLATPNEIKPYVSSGCVQSAVLWNPVDLGYASVYVMRALADGDLKPGDTSVRAGSLGELLVENGSEIVLGSPLIFDARTINNLNF